MSTLASDIITYAYRESNLIPLGQTANANQQAEALKRLNSILLSTVGNEAGDSVEEINIGGTYDQSDVISNGVPANARLMLNLTSETTIYLNPYPTEGHRLAIVDISGNLSTYNLIIDPSGRFVEGASSLTINTDGQTTQWMYRSDTGNWTKISALLSSDLLPFPEEFDDYFITMLALRINPRYGLSLAPETANMLTRMRGQIRSRYRSSKEIMSDLPPYGLATDRTGMSANFDFGNPYPWI